MQASISFSQLSKCHLPGYIISFQNCTCNNRKWEHTKYFASIGFYSVGKSSLFLIHWIYSMRFLRNTKYCSCFFILNWRWRQKSKHPSIFLLILLRERGSSFQRAYEIVRITLFFTLFSLRAVTETGIQKKWSIRAYWQ